MCEVPHETSDSIHRQGRTYQPLRVEHIMYIGRRGATENQGLPVHC